jgi:hypothetical protein
MIVTTAQRYKVAHGKFVVGGSATNNLVKLTTTEN